jgi:hypothetical protein
LILCLLLVARKEKKKEEEEERETASKLFFPGRDMPCWLCHTGFSPH